jgi:CelD/BcsL family acetyltransferase involved in cellulose biosynthesis
LSRRGREIDAYRALFASHQREWAGWRRFRIAATADTQYIAASMPENLRGYRVHTLPSYRVDLAALRGSGSAYVPTLGRNLRHNLQHMQRTYEEVHGPLRVDVADETGTALEWLEELRLLHERRWRTRGQEGAFTSAFFLQFHRELVRRHNADGLVQLIRVSAGSLVFAYLYNLFWRGTTYFYNCGLNYGAVPRYGSPGSLGLSACIQHCLEAGHQAFDFLAGSQDYKRRLATGKRTLEWVDVRRYGLAHRVEGMLARMLRRDTFGKPLASAESE